MSFYWPGIGNNDDEIGGAGMKSKCPYCNSEYFEMVVHGSEKIGKRREVYFCKECKTLFLTVPHIDGEVEDYVLWQPPKAMTIDKPLTDEQLAFWEEEKKNSTISVYPQDEEKNEYRYISPDWLDAVATGLTAGAKKHPNETWRQIPAKEHAARALRHLNLYLMGDKQDKHLINASMRCMMAFETEAKAKDRDEWERLMRADGRKKMGGG